jgi:hypothetical protein
MNNKAQEARHRVDRGRATPTHAINLCGGDSYRHMNQFQIQNEQNTLALQNGLQHLQSQPQQQGPPAYDSLVQGGGGAFKNPSQGSKL